IDNLTVKGEAPKLANNRKMRKKEVFDAQKPEDIDLQTIQKLKQRLEVKDAKRPYYKYRSELFINYNKKEEKPEECAVPGQDILIFIRVYHPFTLRPRNTPKRECGSVLRLNNVIAVLGSQTLAQLRDKISCIADYSISKECSNNLDNAIGPMAKVIY
ncbi:hypothetical protein WN48_05099, partial [Eufriesea mexicana]